MRILDVSKRCTQRLFLKNECLPFLPGSVCDGIAVDYVNQLLFYTETTYDVIVVVSLNNPDIYRTIVNDTLDEPRDIIVDSVNG